MSTILSSKHLGKRYGSLWALKDCSFDLDQGRVTGLIGPNGAGKSTLLELAVGLLAPTEGTIQLFNSSPTREPMKVLPRVGFVAQEHPLYRDFSVAEMLEFGRKTNPGWDDAWSRERIRHIGLQFKKKTGQLSGGQQAQLALVLALAKKPDLLLLDEPIAGFDPLARREFLQILMETVAESGVAVLLSSHIIGDIESVCDSLVLLSSGRVQLADSIKRVLESHRLVIGPVGEEMLASCPHTVIDQSSTKKQIAMLIKLDAPLVLSDMWSVHEPTLEEVVLGYMQRRNEHCLPLKEEKL